MALYTGLLNSNCSIYRLSGYSGTYDYSSSDFGEVDESWGIAFTNVPCRKDARSTRTLRLTGGMIETGGTIFFFKQNADIRDGDRIVLDSKIYFVEDATSVPGLIANHHKEVLVRLIDQDEVN